MADRLSLRLGCLCGLLLASAPVLAEELRDPTRPPAVLNPSVPVVAPAAPVLQSVIISPGRRAAIINGQTLELGDSYGDAKLIKVNEADVVLKNSAGARILRLFPLVDKQARPATSKDQAAEPQPGRKASTR